MAECTLGLGTCVPLCWMQLALQTVAPAEAFLPTEGRSLRGVGEGALPQPPRREFLSRILHPGEVSPVQDGVLQQGSHWPIQPRGQMDCLPPVAEDTAGMGKETQPRRQVETSHLNSENQEWMV